MKRIKRLTIIAILKISIIALIFSIIITYLNGWGAVGGALLDFAGFAIILGILAFIGYVCTRVFK